MDNNNQVKIVEEDLDTGTPDSKMLQLLERKALLGGEYGRYKFSGTATKSTYEEDENNLRSYYNAVILLILKKQVDGRIPQTCYMHIKVQFPNVTASTNFEEIRKIINVTDLANLGSCRMVDLVPQFTLEMIFIGPRMIGDAHFPAYRKMLRKTLQANNGLTLLEKIAKVEHTITSKVSVAEGNAVNKRFVQHLVDVPTENTPEPDTQDQTETDSPLSTAGKQEEDEDPLVGELLMGALTDLLKKLAPGLPHKISHYENDAAQCYTLLVTEELEVSMFAGYRIVFDPQNFREFYCSETAKFLYTLVAYERCLTIFKDVGFFKSSYLCFLIEDDSRLIISTGLRSVNDYLSEPDIPFPEDRRLSGKFYLSLLLVHLQHIDNMRLREQFVTNIRIRLRDPSDETSLLEKAKMAEKWLLTMTEPQKEKMLEQQIQSLALIDHEESTSTFATTSETDDHEAIFEPVEYGNKYIFVARMFIEKQAASFLDLLDLYAETAVSKLNEHYSDYLKTKSQVMFEFRIEDGTIFTTELRPHSRHSKETIAEDLQNRTIPTEAHNTKFFLSIFILHQIGSERSNDKVMHLVNLFRRQYERSFLYQIHLFCESKQDAKFKRAFLIFDECTEPYNYQCHCNKFHLRDICIIEASTISYNKRLIQKEWTLSWTERSLSSINISIILSVVANRLCLIDLSETFNVGTHLLFTFEFGKNRYETEFRHHSEQTQEQLDLQLYNNDNVHLKEKVKITVFVVHTLDFVSKKAAFEALNKLRTGKQDASQRPKFFDKCSNEQGTLPDKERKHIEQQHIHSEEPKERTPLFEMSNVSSNPWEETSSSTEVESLLMDSSMFKKNSEKAQKVSTTSIPVSFGYTVLSSSTKLCTSKSKIILFSISLNNQYLEEIIDDNLFISNIIMDIINKNGTGYPIRKDRRITIKLIMDGKTIQAVINKECNPNVIKEEMFRERSVNVQKQFRLEVQYRLLN